MTRKIVAVGLEIFLILTGMLLAGSCTREYAALDLYPGSYTSASLPGTRGVSPETRKVMLLYAAGFNTLSGDISENIGELEEGYIPVGAGREDDVLLVFSHLRAGAYSNPTEPVLVRLYRTSEASGIIRDTLHRWAADTPASSGTTLKEVWNYILRELPAKGYGMVFSSHATGWLPPGYFAKPSLYGDSRSAGGSYSLSSIGQEYYGGGTSLSQEMTLREMADAIPVRLDYLIFDCCLLGSVEVAYAFRDVADLVAFSPTEIMSKGFDYVTMASRLLQPKVPDVQGACEDYFERYNSGKVYGGATITLLRSDGVDALAAACAPMFEKYRSALRTLDGNAVQRYDRMEGGKNYLCMFDLKDMIRVAGASAEELSLLQDALDACIVYTAHTAKFLEIEILRSCGLSMYLPARPDYAADRCHGTRFLDTYYRENIAWNDATVLVQ